MKLLEGKNIILTGASRGIGKGIAKVFAIHGANIAFTYLSSEKKAKALEAELGAFGITAELIQTYGADGYIGNLASTMNGSTETTFYVLAVYFGSVGVHRYRHALWSGLAADITGVFASILAVQLLLG